MKRLSYSAILLLLLFLPLVGILMLSFSKDLLLDVPSFSTALLHSVVLSSITAGISVFVGFLGAIGIAGTRNRSLLETAAIAPSGLPSLFVLIALLAVISPFPFGWVGSILGAVITTSGLVTMGLSNAISEKTKGVSEAALVMGVSKLKFIVRIVFPLLRKDLVGAAALVFAFTFSSFTIPFILGAGKVRTLEFAIYQYAYRDQNYFPALCMGVLQFIMLSLLATRGAFFRQDFNFQSSRVELLDIWVAKLFAIGPFLILAAGVALTTANVVPSVNFLIANSPDGMRWLGEATIGTFALSLSVGALTVFMFKVSARLFSEKWLEKIILGFQSPSTVLLSLGIWGLLLIPIAQIEAWQSLFFTAFALLTAFFCVLYRMSWSGQMSHLAKQIDIARVLGSDDQQVMDSILWPQMKPLAYKLGGVASFWAAGDFAFSTLLSGQDWNLSLIAESFLSYYRIHVAMIVVMAVMVIGAGHYLLFRRLGHVDT